MRLELKEPLVPVSGLLRHSGMAGTITESAFSSGQEGALAPDSEPGLCF